MGTILAPTGHSARLARGYDEHPDVMRLATWQRLERAGDPPLKIAVESNRAKITEIVRAQEAGTISSKYPAGVILALVLHLAALWSAVQPEMAAAADLPPAAERYTLVAGAVRNLLGVRET